MLTRRSFQCDISTWRSIIITPPCKNDATGDEIGKQSSSYSFTCFENIQPEMTFRGIICYYRAMSRQGGNARKCFDKESNIFSSKMLRCDEIDSLAQNYRNHRRRRYMTTFSAGPISGFTYSTQRMQCQMVCHPLEIYGNRLNIKTSIYM